MPIRLRSGQGRTFSLDMAPTEHQAKNGVFRLMTNETTADRTWSVAINGTQLKPTGFVRKPLDHPYESGMGEPTNYACFACPRQLVQDGVNQIRLTLSDGPAATVRYWDLVLP